MTDSKKAAGRTIGNEFGKRLKRYWLNREDDQMFVNMQIDGLKPFGYTLYLKKSSLKVGILVPSEDGLLNYHSQSFELPFQGKGIVKSHSVEDEVLSICVKHQNRKKLGGSVIQLEDILEPDQFTHAKTGS